MPNYLDMKQHREHRVLPVPTRATLPKHDNVARHKDSSFVLQKKLLSVLPHFL